MKAIRACLRSGENARRNIVGEIAHASSISINQLPSVKSHTVTMFMVRLSLLTRWGVTGSVVTGRACAATEFRSWGNLQQGGIRLNARGQIHRRSQAWVT